jgi:dolichol kinase
VAGIISGAAVSWLILPTFPPFIGAIAGLAAAITWWLMAERKIKADA